MSIYRTLDEGPVSEFSTRPMAVRRERPATTRSQSPADDAHKARRKATPASDPLPVTFKWIASLPRDVQPRELLRQYPRVANALAASWYDCAAFEACLYNLLIDRRGNRKGFPQPIVSELLALRGWFEERQPLTARGARR
jgi:hypothetical protein